MKTLIICFLGAFLILGCEKKKDKEEPFLINKIKTFKSKNRDWKINNLVRDSLNVVFNQEFQSWINNDSVFYQLPLTIKTIQKINDNGKTVYVSIAESAGGYGVWNSSYIFFLIETPENLIREIDLKKVYTITGRVTKTIEPSKGLNSVSSYELGKYRVKADSFQEIN